MAQLKIILERLKNPSVLLSIASQIISILVLLKINVDVDAITGIITAVSSILVLLGILSNPTTQNKGYGDDLLICAHCGKQSEHVMVNGQLVCKECGCTFGNTK